MSHSHHPKRDASSSTLAEDTPLLSSFPPVQRSTSISQATTGVASPATSQYGSICHADGTADEGYFGDASDASDASSATQDEEDGKSQKAKQSITRLRAFGVAANLFLLLFLQAANMSGMTTLQSSIATSLDASGSQALWFTSSYLIAMSSFSPIMGRLSQIFPPRYLVVFASVLLSVGGLVTGVARNFEVFVAGRLISGIGGAGMMTLSLILVLELTGPKRRGLFIGLVNTGYTIGVSLGAVVAGALLGVVGWRPLFYAQTPLSLLGGMGIFFFIPTHFTSPTSTNHSAWHKIKAFDYLGAVLLISTITSFLYGLSSSPIVSLPIVISAVLLPVFVTHELAFASSPLIPVSLLKSRGVLLTCIAQLGFMSVRWSVLFYTPIYALSLLGWAPAKAGSILIPTNAGFALGGLIAGHFHIRRSGSFWAACIISFGLFAGSVALLASLTTAPTSSVSDVGGMVKELAQDLRWTSGTQTHVWAYITTTFILGLFTGSAVNYTLAHLLHLTDSSTHFIASSLIATFRGFAGSFGSAIGGGIFLRTLRSQLQEGIEDEGLIRKLLSAPALVPVLEGKEGEVARASYGVALRRVFFLGAGLAAVMILVQAGSGWIKGEKDIESEDDDVVVAR